MGTRTRRIIRGLAYYLLVQITFAIFMLLAASLIFTVASWAIYGQVRW